MKAFTVTYSMANDITKITFSKDFEEADSLLKADILKDAIGDLNEAYKNALSQFRDGLERIRPSEENV